MNVFDPAEYGDNAASFYDQLYPSIERGLLSTLTELAGGGPALDLGIGTGRVALPLARGGVRMHGIDSSLLMIESFRARPGAASIPVVHGNFAVDSLGTTPFRLIYALVSTLSLLPSPELQQACLFNVARHLAVGGLFVSESSVDQGHYPSPSSVAIPIHTGSQVSVYRFSSLVVPLPVLDGMASAAGLILQDRWGSWDREPYLPSMPRHISVYRREEHGAP